MEFFFTSLNAYNVAALIARVSVGVFFIVSGYYKLTNKERHASLVATLKQCHIPEVQYMQWFVPAVEYLGGLGLLFGFLTYLDIAGLLCICLVATCTDGYQRVKSWQPITVMDNCNDYFYLPEVMYITLLGMLALIGPGIYSVDHAIYNILWQ